ncbi:MFS transporter [Jatrophihabitans telluris]|uniref:MFS transporter n=1 Tax=Jatrophihabitans telluris TaxID=2038343 RepID=A0ABY4QWA4_9ACTN|nr:MFS transporter [Jatrophihabitans telluris]UQX87569.1 MFS transporter [Jatrophihabitans telluris]
MTSVQQSNSPSSRTRRRLHRAWWVAGITFLALIASAAFRSSTGVLIEPLENEFGWSRSITSFAITVNLVIYGLTAPFAAALMQKFGIRRIVALSLTLVTLGCLATIVMRDSWQLVLAWGFAIGIGTGSMALVFGAIIANRWFVTRRGLVTGIFSAASSTGQLVFLPLMAALIASHGWRTAVAVVAGFSLLLVPLVLWLLADSPADVGEIPYGAEPGYVSPDVIPQRPARLAISTLVSSSRSWTFWVLMVTFFICGWSTNGLIGSHFIPAAHDHGMPATTAANLLALIGIFDIVGTIGSGWLTDRVDPRNLLVAYYGLRGLSLLIVPTVLGSSVDPPLFLFIVFYGLDWVATVPPTVALCREHFGLQRSGVVFGWVYASHMVGAGIAASFAGTVRAHTGDYRIAWLTAGALCVLAALLFFTVRGRGEYFAPTEISVVSSPGGKHEPDLAAEEGASL